MQEHYDYIITGGGCAGLSLLRSMMRDKFFNNKKILLIDKVDKNVNDRTWCFWEDKPGLFEDIVYSRWQQFDFHSDSFSARFDFAPYEYKMIRGIDMYTAVLNEAKQYSNIDIVKDEVLSVQNNDTYVTVTAHSNEFKAGYVFNSIIFNDWRRKAIQQKKSYVMLQHFKGWLVETEKEIFNESIATFMDFRVNQDKGATFVYTLPVAKNKALIEYTLFSEDVLHEHEYDEALKKYIENNLGLSKYSISHSEFGIIPMTNYKFSKGQKRIINIGVAGGKTKASSGYTYKFIQKHSAKIISALINNKDPLCKPSLLEKRFNLYDSIFLNVLHHKKMSGDKLFAQLFQKNPAHTILRFLDNETDLKEELKIMNSVPINKFLPAALTELIR